MNIVVLSHEGNVLTRPDTTWEKDNEDLFVPDFVHAFKYSPVLFARINKPGRSIGEKFAVRYYDAIGYGIFLYPEDLLHKGNQGWACASCLDHTSFLPHPLFSPLTLGHDTNFFELFKDGKSIFKTVSMSKELIENAICATSRVCYLRCGDFVAIELSEIKELCKSSEKKSRITATYCDNPTIDFQIIF